MRKVFFVIIISGLFSYGASKMNSGGAEGTCTGASGILAQFELLDILQQGYTATLDRPSETYWFDDKVRHETFIRKKGFSLMEPRWIERRPCHL